MSDDVPQSNWTEAVSANEMRCPHCGETSKTLMDFHAGIWFCRVCGRTWHVPPKEPKEP